MASLLGLCDINTYEGEAAILLENQIQDYDLADCKSYLPELDGNSISTKQLFAKLYDDFGNGEGRQKVIANFLYTLATIVFKIAKRNNITDIAFSGGVFQNSVLLDMLIELAGNNYKLYFHKNLSPNDENISFGQLMYYQNIGKHEISK